MLVAMEHREENGRKRWLFDLSSFIIYQAVNCNQTIRLFLPTAAYLGAYISLLCKPPCVVISIQFEAILKLNHYALNRLSVCLSNFASVSWLGYKLDAWITLPCMSIKYLSLDIAFRDDRRNDRARKFKGKRILGRELVDDGESCQE